jgi:hypothetical protein
MIVSDSNHYNSYVALQASTGQPLPTTVGGITAYWATLAAQGAQGLAGNQGANGPAGPAGPTGATGPAGSGAVGTTFSAGIPYSVNSHQANSSTAIYCSVLNIQCTTSANVALVYTPVPTSCSPQIVVYSNASMNFNLEDVTTGTSLGNCSTTSPGSTCHISTSSNISQGNVLYLLTNVSGNFTTAFSCQ